MYVTAYDARRVIIVSLHTGGPLTATDIETIVTTVRRAIRDSTRECCALCSLVIVESIHGPDATQRKRIGEAASLVTRGHTAFVMPSPVLRAIATGIGWFRTETGNVQSTHGTYEAARSRLVKCSGHPPGAFDALARKVRDTTSELALHQVRSSRGTTASTGAASLHRERI
jgi:hypothetical protein